MYTSDWRSHSDDSQATCVTCHNVHGSTQLSMVRDGTLVSRKPGLQVSYYKPGVSYQCGGPWAHYPKPANVPLPQSTGTVWRASTKPLCRGCHGGCGFNSLYKRKAVDVSPPFIHGVYGRNGYNKLVVLFSEGTYATGAKSGNLAAGDFSLTDADNNRTVVLAAHTAGARSAMLTLSSNLDSSGDMGTDTLGAKTASIFDAAANPMLTFKTVLGSDSAAPAVSKVHPSSNATGVYAGSKISFTLADAGCGVSWSSLSIKVTGNKGYSKTYASGTAAVSSKGTLASYEVTVLGAPFGSKQTITVTVAASDQLGNAMSATSWSFTTAP